MLLYQMLAEEQVYLADLEILMFLNLLEAGYALCIRVIQSNLYPVTMSLLSKIYTILH